MLLAIGALGQLELQACALDQWAAHWMVSPSRSARSSSSFVQYAVLSSEREIPASLKMQPRGRSQNGQHVAPRKAIDTNFRGVIPPSRSSTQAALLTCGARGENRAHEFSHLLLYSRPLGCSCSVVLCDAVSCPLVHSYIPKSLSPVQEFLYAKCVQLTLSCVRLGQSFKTVGYGCTSCWGCVGAGDVEADVIYIIFIGASNT